MKLALSFVIILFLLSIPNAFADTSAPAYVELADAPTITVDWSKGNTQTVTLHGNRTLIFTNGQKAGRYTLIIKQDATGSRTITWPPSAHWPGDTPLMLTTTANRKDYFTFLCDGESYDGVGVSQNFRN